MAQVPYNPVADVSPDAKPPDDYVRVQANPSQFGGLVAQGAEALGKGAQVGAQHWEEIQTDDMSNQAQKAGNDIVEGFKTKYGQDALDAQEGTRQQLSDTYDSFKNKLSTPDQVRAFDQANRPFFDRYLTGNLNTHANQQGQEFKIKTADDAMSVANTMAATAGSSGSEKDAGIAYNKALTAASKKLQTLGLDRDPDALDNAKQSAASSLKSYAEALSIKNPKGALDFVQRNKDKFGTLYEPVFNSLSERADQSIANGVSADALTKAKIAPQTQVAGGARNNNPGNIVDGSWAQSQPGYAGSNGRFAVFDSTASGAAAMGKNLASYASQGISTLNQLTSKWAPAGDGANDPAAYARTISAATGIDPNTPINLADPAIQAKIVPAMARVEQGHAVAGLTGPTGAVVRPAAHAALGSQPQPFGQPTIPEQVSTETPTKLPVENAALTTSAADVAPQPEIAASPEDTYARQVQFIGENSDLTDRQKKMAYADAQMNFTKAQIAAEQDAKAQREQKETVLNDINGTLRTGDPQQAYEKLNQALSSKKINETEFASISDVIAKRSGAENPVAYGKGYQDLLGRVVASYSDPGKTMTEMDLWRSQEQGLINAKGHAELSKAIAAPNKQKDEIGTQTLIHTMLDLGGNRLSKLPGTNIKIPGGDEKAASFQVAFYNRWNDYRNSDDYAKKGDAGFPLFDTKEVEKLADSLTPQREQRRAQQEALAAASGQTLPPEAPADVTNEEGWNTTMRAPPQMDTSKYPDDKRTPTERWANTVSLLVRHANDPKTIQTFDRLFKDTNYRAMDILKGLGVKFTAPPGYAPPPTPSQKTAKTSEDFQQRFPTSDMLP